MLIQFNHRATEIIVKELPDRPFHNFEASKSVDQPLRRLERILRLDNCERVGRAMKNISKDFSFLMNNQIGADRGFVPCLNYCFLYPHQFWFTSCHSYQM